MALLKPIVTPYDSITADYWKVIKTEIDWLSKWSRVELAGWLTEEARRLGRSPIMTRSFCWESNEFPFDLAILNAEGENVIKVAYEKIKAMKAKVFSMDENGNQIETEVDGEFADSETC
jgi:hypothetical protein